MQLSTEQNPGIHLQHTVPNGSSRARLKCYEMEIKEKTPVFDTSLYFDTNYRPLNNSITSAKEFAYSVVKRLSDSQDINFFFLLLQM